MKSKLHYSKCGVCGGVQQFKPVTALHILRLECHLNEQRPNTPHYH